MFDTKKTPKFFLSFCETKKLFGCEIEEQKNSRRKKNKIQYEHKSPFSCVQLNNFTQEKIVLCTKTSEKRVGNSFFFFHENEINHV